MEKIGYCICTRDEYAGIDYYGSPFGVNLLPLAYEKNPDNLVWIENTQNISHK